MKKKQKNPESKHIICLYANDLYGQAMSKFLPINGFKWIKPKKFVLNKYTNNSLKGCVLDYHYLTIIFQIQIKHKPEKKCYLIIN